MEHVYATLLLNETGEEINETNLTATLEAAGASVVQSRVKALVAALEDVDLDGLAREAGLEPADVAEPVHDGDDGRQDEADLADDAEAADDDPAAEEADADHASDETEQIDDAEPEQSDGDRAGDEQAGDDDAEAEPVTEEADVAADGGEAADDGASATDEGDDEDR